MKNIITIIAVIVLLAGITKAQSVSSIWIDLDSADSYNQQYNLGNSYLNNFIWPYNNYYSAMDSSFKYCIVAFDSLVDINPANTSTGPVSYSYSNFTSLYLDSIQIACGQQNWSGIDDTLEVVVLAVDANGYPTSTILATQTMIIPATNPLSTGNSWYNLAYPSFNFNFALPASGKFAIQVNYYDQTKLDTFGIIAGYGWMGNCMFTNLGNAQHTTMYGANNTHEKSNSFMYYTQFNHLWPNANDQGLIYVCQTLDTGLTYAQNIKIMAYLSTTPNICNGLYVTTFPAAATCNTCVDGSVTADHSGGTSPFTYLWNNGATTQNISGLNPGNYTVTITDANSCTSVSAATVDNNACVGYSITLNPTGALCNTCADGWVSCSITGGTSPYTFAWNTSPIQTTQNATGLLPGFYVVNVTDANGCTAYDSANIMSANVCSANFLLYPDSIAHTYFIVNQSYGTPTIHYDWNWGDNSFHDTTEYPAHTYATAGNYTICLNITDGVGCSTSYCDSYYLQRNANSMISVHVLHPATGLPTITDKNYVSILPNPNNGIFMLAYHLMTPDAELRIMDLAGRVVHNQIVSGTDGNIIVSANLNPGIYYWEMISNAGIADKGKIEVMR